MIGWLDSLLLKIRIWRGTAVFGLFLTCIVFTVFPASAADARLSDSAGFLSAQEQEIVEKDLNEILSRNDFSVSMITSTSIGTKDEAEKYLAKQKKNIADKDFILILASVKKEECVCKILAYGKAKNRLTEKRRESLENFVEKKLSGQNYFDALHELPGKILEQYAKAPVFDLIFFHPFFQLLVCLFVTIGGLYLILYRKKAKLDQGRIRYFDQKYSTMQGSIDHFSHKSFKAIKTKKKKEKQGKTVSEKK